MRFRLPFVILPRHVYDDLRLELFVEQGRTQQERDRVQALTDTIVAFKTAGAVDPRIAREQLRLRLEARAADPVQRAIDENEYAQANPALRRHLAQYADQQRRRKGYDEDALIAELESWADDIAPDAEDEEPV